MQFDHRRADAPATSSLLPVGIDEQRDADAGRAELRHDRRELRCAAPTTSSPPSVVRSSRRSGTMQAACGRCASAIASISAVAAISRLSGSRDLAR